MLTKSEVMATLARHVGVEKGVHIAALVKEITGTTFSDAATERDVRHLISALREEGAHICGHPRHGYFIAATAEELRTYGTDFLRKRALHSLQLVSRMENIAMPELLGQMNLNT